MKFKFDENLPSDLGALLRADGHDAHSVLDEDLRGAAAPPPSPKSVRTSNASSSRSIWTSRTSRTTHRRITPESLSCDWHVRTAIRCLPSFLASLRCSRRNPLQSVSGLWTTTEHESEARCEPSPNHVLQRTAPRVTPAASCLRLSPTTQRSRQPRGSLSLRSLGVATRPSNTVR